eukprot:tig00000227_g19797.t1
MTRDLPPARPAAMLTVEETLRFAARVKALAGSERGDGEGEGGGGDREGAGGAAAATDAAARVHRVGNQAARGISGGLDAPASLDLVRCLRGMAASGLSVVCSLLQPELYDQFDRAIFALLYARFSLLVLRNRRPLRSRLIQVTVMGTILGTLHFQLPESVEGVRARVAYLQVEMNYEHRRVMHRQTEERMYRPAIWVAAYVASELPRIFIEMLIFSVSVYFWAGLQTGGGAYRFGRFLLVVFQARPPRPLLF